jgi:hypothetical protein
VFERFAILLVRALSRSSGAALVFAGFLTLRDETAPRAYPTLQFEYAGCARVRPGPSCELRPGRELTFWIAGELPLDVDASGRASTDVRESRAVEGGQRVRFRVPAKAHVVRLSSGRKRAELRVAENSESAQIGELTRSWQAGGTQRVRALLEQSAPRQTAERERMRAFRARLSLREGNDELAATELEATSQSAREAGLLLEAGNDLLAAAYCRAVRLAQYERARTLLESAPSELTRVPEFRARRVYYLGVLARTTGDAQGALLHFRRAGVLARRLGLVADERLARQELAVTLNQLRRHAEALAEQRALVAEGEDEPSCVLSLRWENLAWILLSQPEPSALEQAASALDHAERLRERCPDPLSRRNQALNRIELALLRRDTSDAAARLRALEANAEGSSTRLAAWQALFLGQLHLLRDDGNNALSAFERADLLAESAQAKDCAYLAKLGRARALARRKDDSAVDAYRAAEQAADALVRWAPFGQGQRLTALQAQESSRELVSLLLEQGDTARALQAAIRGARRMWGASFRASRIASASGPLRRRWDEAAAHYRARRQELERRARDDWKLSREGLDALRLSRAAQLQALENALADAYALLPKDSSAESDQSPRDDEARLLLAAGSDAWWAFGSRGSKLQVERVWRFPPGAPLAPDPSQRREVERGLAGALERFQRAGQLDASLLRVTLPPELATIDVHALDIAGKPLIEWVPVAYAFEPDAGRERPPPDAPSLGELILGDPSADLSWAAAEALRVAKRFPDAQVLLGEKASFEAVTKQLLNSRLFHFAGHANSGGIDGLDGALRLRSDQRLSFGDVLALERVPDFVVLSSCTSSVSPEPASGLSIGQAFLVAGSRVVVGASRSISDSLAQRYVQALYDRLLRTGGASRLPYDSHAWAAAIRAAGQDVRRSDAHMDWSSMRLLLP